MNEFDNLQRLLRLKQYETPGEDFVEDFVSRFRERQRSEMLRQSARGLLWERLNTFLEDLISPRWSTAAATAALAVAAAWGALQVMDGGRSADSPAFAAAQESPAPLLPHQPALAVDSELIKEAEQAQEIQIESILLSRHFEGDELTAAALPQMTGSALPVSLQLLPSPGIGRY